MNKIVVAQRLVSSSLVLLITRERSSKELMSSKLRVHLCHKRPGWGNIQIIGLIQIDPFQGHIKLTSKTLKLLLVDDMGEYETDRLLTLFFDEFILFGVSISLAASSEVSTYLNDFKYSSLYVNSKVKIFLYMYTLLWRARMTGFFRGEDIKGGFEQMYKIKIGYPKIKKNSMKMSMT